MPVTFETVPEWQPAAIQDSDLAAAFPEPLLPDLPLPQPVSSIEINASIKHITACFLISTPCNSITL